MQDKILRILQKGISEKLKAKFLTYSDNPEIGSNLFFNNRESQSRRFDLRLHFLSCLL